MKDGAFNEVEKLRQNGDTGDVGVPKYKDQTSCLCSAKWRTAICIFFAFILLMMHRVNLSLAVVCMVDTTKSEINANFYNTSNYSLTNGIAHSKYSYTNSEHNETVIDEVTAYDDNPSNSYFVNDNGNYKQDMHDGDFEQTLTSDEAASKDTACGEGSNERKTDLMFEIHWTKAEISILLSSYFYGSFFTQIPAGTLADKYGGKHIITVTIAISGACALVTPICARTSLILMFVVRIILGLAGGAVVPAGMSMINKWSLPRERPVIIAFCGSGFFVGIILTYLTSGLLCVYGFDNGWPSIFYLHGAVSIVFVIVWCCTAYSSPSEHPSVSQDEVEYIQKCKGDVARSSDMKRKKIPWLPLITSKPLWASVTAHVCFNWSLVTVLVNVPMFMKEVLKFEITSNGLFSSLPYVFQIISAMCCSTLSESIIKKHNRWHLIVRRTFNTVSLAGIAVSLIMAGFVSCESRYVAVCLLCLSCLFSGVAYGGFFANHAEYSGQFAGTTFGITNAAGVISSLLASMMAGLLTPNGLQEEWRNVFFLAAGVDIFGAIVFAICSDVNVQPWARNQTTFTIDIDAKPPTDEISPLHENTEPDS